MNKSGFTLVELLIVIAIIGILAAVLLPNLIRARQAASNRATQVYANTVYKAALAYQATELATAIPVGDCSTGYAAGSYSIKSPVNTIQACSIALATDKSPVVVVSSVYGVSFSMP